MIGRLNHVAIAVPKLTEVSSFPIVRRRASIRSKAATAKA